MGSMGGGDRVRMADSCRCGQRPLTNLSSAIMPLVFSPAGRSEFEPMTKSFCTVSEILRSICIGRKALLPRTDTL